MLTKLFQMNSMPRGSVWLFSSEHTSDWDCHVSGEHDGLKFEIKVTADTPEEAIESAYEKWSRITSKMPEFSGALPAPDYLPF